MIQQFLDILGRWDSTDWWIVVTAALASMSCSVPGVFLLVRRQSMLGDALSHTTLPGIAIAFLGALWLREWGWISDESYGMWRHAIVVAGAAFVGVLSAILTQLVQKTGGVDPNAALGVVFTSLFALGLLLIRLLADKIDLDPDCVLYGTLETTDIDRAYFGIPRAAVLNGCVLVTNLILVAVFFKELRISAFDPALATSMGINAQAVHYALMSVTAMTLVAAFESVGSILVIAMLVAPAATASLLTDRLSRLVVISLAVAAISAGLGHVAAITLPSMILPQLGWELQVDASTAGMMAVAGGTLFATAVFFAPRYGVLSQTILRTQLAVKVVAQDLLGGLYRLEEQKSSLSAKLPARPRSFAERLARRWLLFRQELAATSEGLQLTELGREHAKRIVRSHRLWETYMARHLVLPDDHLHDTAERVEHYIDGSMRAEIEAELARPGHDPHGREIPSEQRSIPVD